MIKTDNLCKSHKQSAEPALLFLEDTDRDHLEIVAVQTHTSY